MSPSLQSTDPAPTNRRSEPRAPSRAALSGWHIALGAALFTILATANGAGYRYGVSDQAFYVPVMTRAIDSALFPRDGALIDAEGRLMLMDEVIAGLVRTTGLSLETLFLAGYVASMVILWVAVVAVGARVYT